MGCHNSKQSHHDLLKTPSHLPRTRSIPLQEHRVSLTSSTLGSLILDTEQHQKYSNGNVTADFSAELEKARTWSAVIDRKIYRTPTETPPHEPETIDALELMAGLEDNSSSPSPFYRHSFSFHPVNEPMPDSGFNIVRERINAFQEKIDAKKANTNDWKNKKVVFYFTSIRGVRKTYDDCCAVRSMLKEYRVRVDERDVSMHGGFREELKERIGGKCGGWLLPRVFVDERDLGGEEDVRRMHESGELGKVFEGMELDFGGQEEEAERHCDGCGDIRFVPCGHCSGSCKVFAENGEEEEEVVEDGDGRGWRRCSKCNENGIVRCPVCC